MECANALWFPLALMVGGFWLGWAGGWFAHRNATKQNQT